MATRNALPVGLRPAATPLQASSQSPMVQRWIISAGVWRALWQFHSGFLSMSIASGMCDLSTGIGWGQYQTGPLTTIPLGRNVCFWAPEANGRQCYNCCSQPVATFYSQGKQHDKAKPKRKGSSKRGKVSGSDSIRGMDLRPVEAPEHEDTLQGQAKNVSYRQTPILKS